jgi:Fe2+ or Zn2+ uptake regulation protein
MPHRTADEEIAKELSQHGFRATRQRIAALRLLRRLKRHPTSAELHARILAEHRNVSQKIVYEILDGLVQAGLASRVTAVGEAYRYEARAEPHYHATCRVCGRLYDVPASADSHIRGRANLPEGFRVEKITERERGPEAVVCSCPRLASEIIAHSIASTLCGWGGSPRRLCL